MFGGVLDNGYAYPVFGARSVELDDANGRLTRVVLEGEALHRISDLQRADREQAVRDLETDNKFHLPSHPDLQSVLHLSIQEGRLVFDIRDENDHPVQAVMLALGPFKTLVRDYRMLLDSYASAVAEGREARIQAIDMGRRGLHNEGAELMIERLAGKVVIDFPTARRLFTLVCALYQKA
jgi:uncharacterized protein (UPF0262 family)